MVLRIAIVGGGIAGASLFLALKGLDGVVVTVFDGARELRSVARPSLLTIPPLEYSLTRSFSPYCFQRDRSFYRLAALQPTFVGEARSGRSGQRYRLQRTQPGVHDLSASSTPPHCLTVVLMGDPVSSCLQKSSNGRGHRSTSAHESVLSLAEDSQVPTDVQPPHPTLQISLCHTTAQPGSSVRTCTRSSPLKSHPISSGSARSSGASRTTRRRADLSS